MWNEPTTTDLARLPPVGATADVPWAEKTVHMHFFLGGSDWFIVEGDAERGLLFGFAVLNHDLANAEWGYVAMEELRDVSILGIRVDRDVHWKPCPAGAVPLIRSACGRS